jgi:hypothetical protein
MHAAVSPLLTSNKPHQPAISRCKHKQSLQKHHTQNCSKSPNSILPYLYKAAIDCPGIQLQPLRSSQVVVLRHVSDSCCSSTLPVGLLQRLCSTLRRTECHTLWATHATTAVKAGDGGNHSGNDVLAGHFE